MYSRGEGVPQDYVEGVKWYRKAAEQGYAEAQHNLGRMYFTGRGVDQDHAEAMRWFRQAADQENAAAQHNLGVMYTRGLGVPQDYFQAYSWFSLSAANGYKEAAKGRDITAQHLTPEQIAEAERLAREWQEKHKKQ
jgi:TPR repeat protein